MPPVSKTIRSLTNKISNTIAKTLPGSTVTSKLVKSVSKTTSSSSRFLPDLTSGSWKTHLVVIIAIVLAIWYIMKRQYQATIFLVVINLFIYFLTKNLFSSVLLGTFITALLFLLNVFKRSEGFKEGTASGGLAAALAAQSSGTKVAAEPEAAAIARPAAARPAAARSSQISMPTPAPGIAASAKQWHPKSD